MRTPTRPRILVTLTIAVCACGSPPGSTTTRPIDGGVTSDTPVFADSAPLLRAGENRVQVPMRDGVLLDTRVLLPTGEGRWPVVLVRTPYSVANGSFTVDAFRAFVSDGYALVVQAVRGTGESGGMLEPLLQEFDDGHDTVEWVVAQPWSTGRVGTLGASYEGFTALAAAIGTPAVKAVVADGAISRAFSGWPGARGIPWWGGLPWWLGVTRGMDLTNDPQLTQLTTNMRPLRAHDQALLGRSEPLWQRMVSELDRDSSYWATRSLDERMRGYCAPTLHVLARTEWEDDPLFAFERAVALGCEAARPAQRFVLSDTDHGGVAYQAHADTRPSRLLRKYFATYLKEEVTDLSSEPAVLYHLQNSSQWRTAAEWPVTREYSEMFLRAPSSPTASERTLATSPPAISGASSWSVDPTADPCVGGSSSLRFESARLERDLDIVGRIEAVLHVSVDAPDADVFAELHDLAPDGTVAMVHLSRVRLRFRNSYTAPVPMPLDDPQEVTILLPAVAYRVAVGHRLVLTLQGSSCGYAENSNTGASFADDVNARTVRTTVHSGRATPSRLRLPFVL